ncbi:MAG TPA: hypothetical protein VLR94_02690, partial [Acidobacteriota bacterium]|nr:hypothetical protein [Acidobacteriota bacterium]
MQFGLYNDCCGFGIDDILRHWIMSLLLAWPYALVRFQLRHADSLQFTLIPLEMRRFPHPVLNNILARPQLAMEHCAYCKAPATESAAVRCLNCRTPHHRECFH